MTSQPTRERSPRRGRDEARPFQRLQIEHFARADEVKFLWQPEDLYLAKTERVRLTRIPFKSSDRLLEAGCGEDGNLQLLGLTPTSAVGVDFSHAKISWVRHHGGAARFVCADATRLPFRDEMFDVVLCRDVLHHVVDKSEAVGELIRVCRLMPMDRWVYIIITAVKTASGKPVVSGSV